MSEDVKGLLHHWMTELEGMNQRLVEKSSELHQFHLLCEEFNQMLIDLHHILQSKGQVSNDPTLFSVSWDHR